ncbi:ABC transporter permease [Lacticaseibacillus jixianensis]|uniref:ABC transporter permease n=1 Tax=Lacticaseibacillus jixianensis TaxID=2486012 RepID=A0ABW4B6C4_9LACO|nr:ABC transporter permease [Lacticaseibacillus jixianensis]
MKKYLFFRVLRSILSIFLVTTLTFILIYTLIPRRDVFKDDNMISKLASKPDSLTDYKNNAFEKMNYLDYLDTKDLLARVAKDDPKTAVTAAHTASNKAALTKWAKANNYTLHRFTVSKAYYATRDLPIWERLSRFYGNMIKIDTPWTIHDKDNPNMPRYLKIQNDPLVGWAVVGSGTKYRYQLYFNSKFPYIHENFLKFDLGTSYPSYAGEPVTEVIGGTQGPADSVTKTFPNGRKLITSDDVYTRAYQPRKHRNEMDYEQYKDDYTSTEQLNRDPSMIGTSVRAGFIGLIISYALAIPIAIYMARKKGKWFDRAGTFVVTVLIAVPSLAFIYAFRYLGASLFGLPDSFPTLGAQAWQSWVLPSVVLGLLGISGLIIWFRRFMIDQQKSDYVKFAKAKGLNENEIYTKHIFKNASIPIVQGIPGSIIGLIGGATMTEEIFAAPGMGKMLPDSIAAHNNAVVIALVFIFTTIAVLSVLLGDIAMVIVDPRIKLSTSDTSKGEE